MLDTRRERIIRLGEPSLSAIATMLTGLGRRGPQLARLLLYAIRRTRQAEVLRVPALFIHGSASVAHILASLRYSFSELRGEELALALAALLFQLEAHLLTIDLIVVAGLISPARLECSLAEVEGVVDLATQLRRRI